MKSRQLSIREDVSVTGCTDCICRDCMMWWSSRCPYGECYDDYRALVNPYDAAHPGEPPRTGWTNWRKDQAYWCRGGATCKAPKKERLDSLAEAHSLSIKTWVSFEPMGQIALFQK